MAPFTADGSNDLVACVLSHKVHEVSGQPAIIDNRPYGGPAIGIELVVRAAPEGYTLLATAGGITISVSLHKLLFNPLKDLSPVMLLAQMP